MFYCTVSDQPSKNAGTVIHHVFMTPSSPLTFLQLCLRDMQEERCNPPACPEFAFRSHAVWTCLLKYQTPRCPQLAPLNTSSARLSFSSLFCGLIKPTEFHSISQSSAYKLIFRAIISTQQTMVLEL